MRDLRRALTDIFNPPRQLPDQFFCAVLDPTGIGNVANIVEDIGQTRRLQIYNCGRTRQRPGLSRHRPISHRADVAKLLGENDVRSQLAHQRFVDRVNRAVLAQ